MKKILGLDLGTTSIGWALVNEAETKNEQSSIIKLGVRLISLENFTNNSGKDIKMKIADAFSCGMGVSTRAARRNARSARTNLARFKQRRDNIKQLLVEAGWISENTMLCESGKNSTHELIRMRAKSATEEVSLTELARILLAINKKRGYKSNRKLKGADEGESIDGMSIARKLYDEGKTPGQYVCELFDSGKMYVPQFYPSDLKDEFVKIWQTQQKVYSELNIELLAKLDGRNSKTTWTILAEVLGLNGIKRKGKQKEQKIENYKWRAKAVTEYIDKEQLAIVLSNINSDISNASGYLGEISDRSKLLYFKKETIGQYLWSLVSKDRHASLKRKVFYREDYLDEFERIWETQSQFHPREMTAELKKKLRDESIFYQRPLKSQKSNIDFCTLESKEKSIIIDGKDVSITQGLRVCPKSSPLFQEFKVWQQINSIRITDKQTYEVFVLNEDQRQLLFNELNIRSKLTKTDVFKAIGLPARSYELNYDELSGNSTRASLYNAYMAMLPVTGHEEIDTKNTKGKAIADAVRDVFSAVGFNVAMLELDTTLEDHDFERQPAYRLWHLLYSSDGKNLKQHLTELGNFTDYPECGEILSKVTFANDYGNLSTKALRRILPFMRQGMVYSDACEAAGYKHSQRSLTRQELSQRVLLDHMPPYKSGQLRNPVVDKVLAQMTNVVNAIIDEFGKPDEVRVEMAREMKKNSAERKRMTEAIKKNTNNAERIRQLLAKDYGIAHPTRNDILRWRLYEELAFNGYHTLYSNTYVRREDVFSKMYDIEHIIPKARLFDDSFSNKTLELTSVNQTKSATTAYDYMVSVCSAEQLEQYKERINKAFVDGCISRQKRDYLLMKKEDIPQDFIQRELRETQYITRQALEMLEKVIPSVVATSGTITDYLRNEWQLVDVMKEINLPKYRALGCVREDTNREGNKVVRIDNWTKRSDHRHHAMDALTVAFTKRGFVQYLNTLNANYDSEKNRHFDAPLPLKQLRTETLRHMENILVSMRTSKKVATTHKNRQTGQTCLTPRGALHAETYYGTSHLDGAVVYTTRKEVGPDLDLALVINPNVRKALELRLAEFCGDAKQAFVGIDSNPVWLNKEAGICIKKVTIRSKKAKEPIAIHVKHNNEGKIIYDKDGHTIPTDFVAPDANHHIAFYKDAKGKMQEQTVTFIEAFERKRQNRPVIDKDYKVSEGWQFVFSLQRGEYILFPDEKQGFDPSEMDLTDSGNNAVISKHLFVVQKLSKKNYMFRHHLDPTTDENAVLKDINWKNIRNIPALNHIVKVRLDSLGKIVESQLVEI